MPTISQAIKLYEKFIPNSSWTSDIWTGLGQSEFAGVTAHFFDQDWLLHRVVLDLFYFPARHTGENIAVEYGRVGLRWGAKPFHMTTDSGANVKLGTRTFIEKEGTPFPSLSLSPTFVGISCKAHELDNLLKAAFKIPAIEELFDRQRATVKFIRKSNNANRALHASQVELHAAVPDPFVAHYAMLQWAKEYSIRPVRLVIAGKTRWWGIIKQNKRFVRLKPALVPVLEDLSVNEDIPLEKRLNFDFGGADWHVMIVFVEILEPFKSAIKELEGPPSRFHSLPPFLLFLGTHPVCPHQVQFPFF